MRIPIQLFGVFKHEDRIETRLDTQAEDRTGRKLSGMLRLSAEALADKYRQLYPDADIYIKITETIFADELYR
jgi:hypothetical protein